MSEQNDEPVDRLALVLVWLMAAIAMTVLFGGWAFAGWCGLTLGLWGMNQAWADVQNDSDDDWWDRQW